MNKAVAGKKNNINNNIETTFFFVYVSYEILHKCIIMRNKTTIKTL